MLEGSLAGFVLVCRHPGSSWTGCVGSLINGSAPQLCHSPQGGRWGQPARTSYSQLERRASVWDWGTMESARPLIQTLSLQCPCWQISLIRLSAGSVATQRSLSVSWPGLKVNFLATTTQARPPPLSPYTTHWPPQTHRPAPSGYWGLNTTHLPHLLLHPSWERSGGMTL